MRGALAFVCLSAALIACSRSGHQEGGPPPADPVVGATAVTKAVLVELRAIGNVQPSNTVTVRARVGGILAAVHFKEGQDVEVGQLLFTLDRGPLEADLRQAQANVAKDLAQWENARKDAQRYAELARQGFVAQQQADQRGRAAHQGPRERCVLRNTQHRRQGSSFPPTLALARLPAPKYPRDQ